MKNKVWLITGCSSGFGRALAEEVIARGEKLVATARKKEKLTDLVERAPDRVVAVSLDVTKADTMQNAVQTALANFDQIDVLVNNAGYGLMGAIEEVNATELRAQMETNFFGLHFLTKAILPHMRKKGIGHIINISSIAGILGSPGLGAYNASKFAVEGLSEALAQEVAPLGLHVTIIEPGSFRTAWAGGSMATAELQISAYDQTARAFKHQLQDAKAYGDPRKAAKIILDIAAMEKPPTRLVLGQDAYEYAQMKIVILGRQLEEWKTTTLSTAEDQ